MMIDTLNFTPMASLLGGVLIGLSVTILLLFNGRIAGLSSTLASLLHPRQKETFIRMAFILGILLAPTVHHLLTAAPDTTVVTDNPYLLVASGLLIGLGTRYASGCTSGHGICGLARLSPRSLAATIVFMLSAFTTVYLIQHVL